MERRGTLPSIGDLCPIVRLKAISSREKREINRFIVPGVRERVEPVHVVCGRKKEVHFPQMLYHSSGIRRHSSLGNYCHAQWVDGFRSRVSKNIKPYGSTYISNKPNSSWQCLHVCQSNSDRISPQVRTPSSRWSIPPIMWVNLYVSSRSLHADYSACIYIGDSLSYITGRVY